MTKAHHAIEELHKKAKNKIKHISSTKELEEWRIAYLGRKGAVPLFLRGIGKMQEEERKEIGKLANKIRQELEHIYKAKKARIKDNISLKNDESSISIGHLHPLTLTIRRIQDIFSAMGFLIVEGPEVENEKNNFDNLNIPFEHSARAETDTFYIKSKEGLLLRTQTSAHQVRAVLENDLTPPFRIISPGRVFRSERTDATHESTFYQFEGLVVGKDITIANFKAVIETFYSTFFQKEVEIRLRTSYFPFVEPGFEVDMSCVFCGQKGCRICKRTGWVEIMGAGMVHPAVLRNMNISDETYQGFAFGGAIDRLAMLRHGINDIRLFWSGDIQFLKQFST